MNANDILHMIEKYKEIILTNLIMVAEIPAPLEKSSAMRAEYVLQRLSSYSLVDSSIDEVGNVIGIIPGKGAQQKNIVLVAHLDTIHDENLEYTVRMGTDTATGVGLVDNSLGVASILSLPYILEDLNISFDSNLIVCFSGGSLGASDLKGVRFFLDHYKEPIDYGICVEGYPLGRISYQSLGSVRQKISLEVSEEYDWSHFGSANAILELNTLMNAILEIPLPNRPKTSILFDRIRGGKLATKSMAHKSSLHIDVRGESNELVEEINSKIEGLVKEQASKTGIDFTLEVISKRKFGGLEYIHPMVQSLVSILDELKIPHRMTPSVGELAAFIEGGIPAVTIGLTQCEQYNTEKEVMKITPLYRGIAQLLSLLIQTDKGG